MKNGADEGKVIKEASEDLNAGNPEKKSDTETGAKIELFNIVSPREVKRVMKELNIRPRKKWGQNFLIDGNIARKILAELSPEISDYVLETGPGLGALTIPLAHSCKGLLAIEIDPLIVDYLNRVTIEIPAVKVIRGDVRKASLSDYSLKIWGADVSRRIKIVANLPYYITSTFLFDLFRDVKLPWTRAVLMVQREVADRINAPVGSSSYGALSVLCRAFTESRLAFQVSSKVFYPEPAVNSAVVVLEPRKGDIPENEKEFYIKFVTSVFMYRRKTLLNAVSYYTKSKSGGAEILSLAGINEERRPETLTPDEFAKISHLLYNKQEKNIVSKQGS